MGGRKDWRCRLGRHQWHRIHEHEQNRDLKECRRCGKRMTFGFPPAWIDGGPGA